MITWDNITEREGKLEANSIALWYDDDDERPIYNNALLKAVGDYNEFIFVKVEL